MKRLLLCTVFLGACTSEGAATRALLDSGYTGIVITGWSPLSCSKDDSTCTGFTAVTANGRHVSGAVGCGYVFKGCTVRLSE